MTKSKRIFVSNRLPFNIDAETQDIRRGSGGLVSALLGVTLSEPFCWLGFETDKEAAQELEEKSNGIVENLKIHPVLIDKTLYENYYDHFCNDVFWPLFHYEGQYTYFQHENWQSYIEANERMAEEIIKIAHPNDSVWIHDFHFLVLPQMLKEKMPDLRVGLFLHTPFPSAEIFRQLPVRDEILKSMIRCDLLGFHEHSYLRHFTVSLKAHLGIDSTFFKADLDDHALHLGVYPISIDIQNWKKQSSLKEIVEQKNEFSKNIPSDFLVLGVDRLDYTKGLELKLKGFRRVLQKYPELRGHINLMQIAIPTRTNVPAYTKLRTEIEQLVGMINGEFGQPEYTPVSYIFNSVNQTDLVALYKRAEALLITSKRDGMNLVSMEYAISQDKQDPGVLILSEFAGAASLLGDSLIINPWDEDSIADALFTAYQMSLDERQERSEGLNNILSKYSATQWAKSFLSDLERINSKMSF